MKATERPDITRIIRRNLREILRRELHRRFHEARLAGDQPVAIELAQLIVALDPAFREEAR